MDTSFLHRKRKHIFYPFVIFYFNNIPYAPIGYFKSPFKITLTQIFLRSFRFPPIRKERIKIVIRET